jgi:hypothetical protein
MYFYHIAQSIAFYSMIFHLTNISRSGFLQPSARTPICIPGTMQNNRNCPLNPFSWSLQWENGFVCHNNLMDSHHEKVIRGFDSQWTANRKIGGAMVGSCMHRLQHAFIFKINQ